MVCPNTSYAFFLFYFLWVSANGPAVRRQNTLALSQNGWPKASCYFTSVVYKAQKHTGSARHWPPKLPKKVFLQPLCNSGTLWFAFLCTFFFFFKLPTTRVLFDICTCFGNRPCITGFWMDMSGYLAPFVSTDFIHRTVLITRIHQLQQLAMRSVLG